MILDGKKTAEKIKRQIKEEIAASGEEISLAVILVGNDPASELYVGNKIKACQTTGIKSILRRLPETATEEEIISVVRELNADVKVDGILVQLPLPKGVDEDAVVNEVDPAKDVDALTYYMQGRLAYDDAPWAPCTPAGVITLLDEYDVDLTGKNAVVIGRSNLAGKPLAALMLKKNATVTLCHRKTRDIEELTKKADVIAVSTGKIDTLTPDMVSEGAIVIDIGIHRTEKGVIGDVDPAVFDKCSYYTPVPGGVGPMTIATLMANTLAAHRNRVKKQ